MCSPETTRPSTAFDDDRYLSREAKRKRASAKSSVGVCATPASLINEHASTPSTRHRYQMNLADGALLNETAWSALVGMSKKNAREAAKAELAAE